MQIDDTSIAGTLVQAIDILGNQGMHMAQRLKPGKGKMCRPRTRLAKCFEANQRPGPVTLARGMALHEVLVLHGRRALPVAGGISVIGNAAFGTDPGAGQHDEPRMSTYKGDESGNIDVINDRVIDINT